MRRAVFLNRDGDVDDFSNDYLVEIHGPEALTLLKERQDYIRDKGGIVWDADAKRFRIDPARLDAAIRALVANFIRLQGNGDYAGAKAFLDKWGAMDAEATQVTGAMTHIPVDIDPIYPARI